ncbi:hypothetical protein GCM10010259_54740 [Streptomyces daghestanicus]|uniref:Uncharacterized protein n=1 Tax=Streptomyces daghestanicus TaxID=66885 RepID=A0ABQ3Q784_9ACTN|nr:hypothetical protein GCM10010259_54740 [Streptomyces daghestanicus]GHI29497.1 hypothetical protein Sdagh_12270 [Streptomyces daghestanicus]GHI33138.1 hypothetical protein Sdagh_48680 [Streptomyces daghestanicus]
MAGTRRRPLVLLGGPGWAGRSGTGTARPSTLPEVLGSLAAASAAPLT